MEQEDLQMPKLQLQLFSPQDLSEAIPHSPDVNVRSLAGTNSVHPTLGRSFLRRGWVA